MTHANPPQRSGESLSSYFIELLPARVGGVMAENKQRIAIPWSTCQRDRLTDCIAEGQEMRWTLELMPDLPDTDSSAIQLSNVRLIDGDAPPRDASGTTAVTHDQRSVVVEVSAPDASANSRVAITPYLIADEEDVRRLFECKRAPRGDTPPPR